MSGGVAAILAALAGGGLKAFGVELPILASVRRQGMLFATGLVLLGLGLFADRLPGARNAADGAATGDEAKATPRPEPSPAPAAAETAAAGQAPGTRIPPISGIQFIAARDVLLRSGWSPIGQGNPMHNENVWSGNGPMFRELGFNEMVACAPSGAANCLFVYRSDTGQVLHVSTLGEGETARVDNAAIVDCRAEPKPEGC